MILHNKLLLHLEVGNCNFKLMFFLEEEHTTILKPHYIALLTFCSHINQKNTSLNFT